MDEREIKKEIDNELEAIELGKRAYMNRLNTHKGMYGQTRNGMKQSDTKPAQTLMFELVPQLTKAIEWYQNDIREGNAGVGYKRFGPYLCAMEANVIASIALKEALNMAIEERRHVSAGFMLAQRIEEAWAVESAKKKAPHLVKEMRQKLKNWSSRRAQTYINQCKALFEAWPHKDKIQLGVFLIEEVLLKHCDLFEYAKLTEKHPMSFGLRQKIVFRFSPKGSHRLSAMHDLAAMNNPPLPPMVAAPKDWNMSGEGGYYSLREKCIKNKQFEMSQSYFMTEDCAHLKALNIMQATSWKVNKDVLFRMEKIWEAGGNIGKMPPSKFKELPPKPNDESIRDEWIAERREIYNENYRKYSLRLRVLQAMNIARRYREKTIWFPHSVDKRGRYYPLPVYLNPQSDDVGRSLLHFADKKELGEEGWKWLKIHCANMYGMDKLPFDERVAWTEKNLDKIRLFAEDSLGTVDEWAEADEPWQFLAACLEIVKAIDSGNPEEFESSLPVSIDASCSAIQLYSALSRNREMASVCNLIDGDEPCDLYTNLLNVVKAKVEEDIGKTEKYGKTDYTLGHIARYWHPKLNRKLVKTAGMTFSYGLTRFGAKEQLLENADIQAHDKPQMLAAYLGDIIYDSLPVLVGPAVNIMDYLQKVAKACNEIVQPISWSTPSGFYVNQAYLKMRKGHVVTKRGTYSIWMPDRKKKLDTKRQVSSIAPNYVHSLDASLVALATVEAYKQGVDSFMLVHDSFGTHACDVEKLGTVLREQMVSMFEEDLLKQFTDEVELNSGAWFEGVDVEMPERGDFNINEILEAKYAYS